MNKELIEYLIRVQPPIEQNDYGDSIVEILTPPKWYHPIKRSQFMKQQPLRIRLVIGEYAKELVNNITVRSSESTDS